MFSSRVWGFFMIYRIKRYNFFIFDLMVLSLFFLGRYLNIESCLYF